MYLNFRSFLSSAVVGVLLLSSNAFGFNLVEVQKIEHCENDHASNALAADLHTVIDHCPTVIDDLNKLLAEGTTQQPDHALLSEKLRSWSEEPLLKIALFNETGE